MLKERARELLLRHAAAGQRVSYRDLAQELGLVPPGIIRRVAGALEELMQDDAAAGRPLLAVFCISRGPLAMPRRGFFVTAEALGIFDGAPDGPAAEAFYATEYARATAFYQQRA